MFCCTAWSNTPWATGPANLLMHGSPQWITRVETKKDTYTVVLEEQLVDHVSKQARHQACPA